MTFTRNLTLAAAVFALSLTGCSGDGSPEDKDRKAPAVQLGAPGESNSPLTGDDAEQAVPPAYTPDDVAFVQGMIPHHEQALVMTAMVAEQSASSDLPQLAQRMDISQRQEIGQLRAWLEARNEPTEGAHAHHTALMPGMLSEDELAQLGRASGKEFDRLFLTFMIRHHEGALVMVADLLAAGGGQEPEIFQLAQHIDADQRVEIARMRSLLAGL